MIMPAQAPTPTPRSRPKPGRLTRARRLSDCTLLVAIVSLTLIGPLTTPPIAHHGEAREALVVRDVALHGQWVLPRRNGELPSKPPLFHWLAAVPGVLFAVNDVTVRFPSALGAVVLVVLTYLLAAVPGGRAAGWLAAGVLLSTPRFWESAAEARVDMLFAACITAALSAFAVWFRRPGTAARACIYAAVAAAVLAKGPAGVVLPALVIGAFLLLQGEPRRVRDLWSLPLAAMLLIVDGGWYALATHAGGRAFLDKQILSENFNRFLGREQFAVASKRATFKIAIGFLTQLLPWNLVVLRDLRLRLRGRRIPPAARFLHVWWLTIVVFFTIAAGQRTVYLLPLYPPIAALTGLALSDWLKRGQTIPQTQLPRRNALAAALALIAFAQLTGVQLVRESRAQRHSLAGFATTVDHLVPSNTVLAADGSCAGTDIQVLAYRLQRRIARHTGGCGTRMYCLTSAASPVSPGRHPLATSHRYGPNLRLLSPAGGDTATCAGGREEGSTTSVALP